MPHCLQRNVVVTDAAGDIENPLPVHRVAGFEFGSALEGRQDVAEAALLERHCGGGQVIAQGSTPCASRAGAGAGEAQSPTEHPQPD
ncbi:MAG: hypothetical protein IPF50_04555 [Proteobacteria bacterium]|nr:hypothetical protein [Pseudomonadota bacterium]